MKRIGLDTSVVLRLLVGTPEDQANRALAFLWDCHRSKVIPVICDLVVAEAQYAICHHYGVSKAIAVERLLKLLESGLVRNDGVALNALREYTGRGAGLIDRMICLKYQRTTEEVVTFDQQFSRLSKARLLQ